MLKVKLLIIAKKGGTMGCWIRKIMRISLAVVFVCSSLCNYAIAGNIGLGGSGYGMPLLVGVDLSGNKIGFAWKLGANGGKKALARRCKQVLSYYYSALAIPDNNWWVDLFIFDTDKDLLGHGLDHTMLGYVMLEADLKMKRLVNRFMSPDSYTGQLLWDKLGEIGVRTFVPRFWMVPGNIEIYTNKGVAYIRKADIKVKVNIEDKAMPRSLKTKVKVLLNSIIVPALEKAINTSKDFAKFRQAYYALVLASWTKKNSYYIGNSRLTSLIDSYVLPDVGAVRVNKAEFLRVFARYYLFSESYNENLLLLGGGEDFSNMAGKVEESQKTFNGSLEKAVKGQGVVSKTEIPPTKTSSLDRKEIVKDYSSQLGINSPNMKFYTVSGKIILGKGVNKQEFGNNINVLNLTKENLVINKKDLELARLPNRLGNKKVSNLVIIQFYDKSGAVKKFVFSPLQEVLNNGNLKNRNELVADVIKKMDVLTWMEVTDVSHIQAQYEKFIKNEGKYINYRLRGLPLSLKERILRNLDKVARGQKLSPSDVLELVVGIRMEDNIPEYSKRLLEEICNIPIIYVNQGGFLSISSTLARTNQMLSNILLPFNSVIVRDLFRPARWVGRKSLDSSMVSKAEEFLKRIETMKKRGMSVEEVSKSFIEAIKQLVKNGKPAGDFIQAVDLGYKKGDKWVFKGLISRSNSDWYHNLRNTILLAMEDYYVDLMEKEGFRFPEKNGYFSKEQALKNLNLLFKPVDEYLAKADINDILKRVNNIIEQGLLPDQVEVKGKVYSQEDIINQIDQLKSIYSKLVQGEKVDLPNVSAKRFWEKAVTGLVKEDVSLRPLLDFYKYVCSYSIKQVVYPLMVDAIEKVPTIEKSGLIIPVHSPGKVDPGHWGHLLVYIQSINKLLRSEVIVTSDNGDPRKPALSSVFLRIYFALTLQFLLGKKAIQLNLLPSFDVKYHNSIGEEIFPEIIKSTIKSSNGQYALMEGYQFGIDHLRFAKVDYIEKMGAFLDSIGFKNTITRQGQAVYYNPSYGVWFVLDNNIGAVVQYRQDQYNQLKKLGYKDEELTLAPKTPNEELVNGSKELVPGKEQIRETVGEFLAQESGPIDNNMNDNNAKAWEEFITSNDNSEHMSPAAEDFVKEQRSKLGIAHKESTDNAATNPGGLLLSTISVRFLN